MCISLVTNPSVVVKSDYSIGCHNPPYSSRYSQLKFFLPHIRVFARCHAEDKAQIVQQLQKESTVGMVGDGWNDVVALHTADVGVSMNMIDSPIQLRDASLLGVVDLVRVGRGCLGNLFAFWQSHVFELVVRAISVFGLLFLNIREFARSYPEFLRVISLSVPQSLTNN